jgi:uncharacterized metal-binding protein YceD (DUF177 family)
MREQLSAGPAVTPWRFPVVLEDIAETGERFELTADADVRTAVAQVAGLRDLPRLEATFEVTRHGATGLHVVGQVSATVGQSCVVTLEPLANEVTEQLDLLFLPRPLEQETEWTGTRDEQSAEAEPLVGGQIDLGALATEFLILGLDPYPRKPGAVFQPVQDATPQPGPFAALAALKKDHDGQ